MGENTLYLDFPGNEVKPIFGSDQVCEPCSSVIKFTLKQFMAIELKS